MKKKIQPQLFLNRSRVIPEIGQSLRKKIENGKTCTVSVGLTTKWFGRRTVLTAPAPVVGRFL